MEKLIVYVCLISGTLLALITKGGADYFASGDLARGIGFAIVALLTAVGWIAPLIPKLRGVGERAGRALILVLALFLIYQFLQHTSVPSWPPAI